MEWITLANPQALFAYAGGSHMCFLYSWYRQGSCGALPEPLLVFLIALLNLTPHRTPAFWEEATQRKEASETTELPRGSYSTCHRHPPPPDNTSTNKAKSLVLYMPFSSTNPAFATMQTNESNGILKLINYYFRLCQNKESGDHSLVLLLLSYINWSVFLFICFVSFR